jgi:FlaA1/EpsC-like NDP-sugar epimerase
MVRVGRCLRQRLQGRLVAGAVLFYDTKGRVFVTGGTGYIGSHTAEGLMEAGHEVVL